MAAISQLINRGIGFTPGSPKYIITLGLSMPTAAPFVKNNKLVFVARDPGRHYKGKSP